MLDRSRWLIEGLAVDPERMLRNLEASHGLVFSGRALLRMVEAGISRERAYEIVQHNAMAAWDREVPLRGLLEADPEVAGVLDAAELDAIFDLDALLVHVDEIFDRTLRRPEVAHA
jgi:adenylosuccinate lyase